MKNIKKTFIILISFLLIVTSLTACSGGDTEGTTHEDPTIQESIEESIAEEVVEDEKEHISSETVKPEIEEKTEPQESEDADDIIEDMKEKLENKIEEESKPKEDKPEETQPAETTPPVEETKPAEKPVEKPVETPKPPKNAVKIIDNISSVESFLKAPTSGDFGADYDNAMKLYNAILNKEPSIVISFDSNWDAMKNFVTTFENNVMSGLFRITVTFTSGAVHNIQCSPKEIYEEISIFNNYRKTVLDMGINEYTTQKDAVTKINNWMINYLTYELSANNPYQAYLNKKANCDGYARLFERFCKVIGVECIWESGEVKTNGTYGAHAWNKVKLDGTWYYIDVCWNDSSNPNRYLLSTTLWNDHTTKLPLKINLPNDKNWGNKVSFQNISDINHYLKAPSEDVFKNNFDAAMAIYNSILNGEDETNIKLFLEEGSKLDSTTLYYDFAEKFSKTVLSGAGELKFWGISWMDKTCDVSARINSKGMRKHLDMLVSGVGDYHNANMSAGVTAGMTEMEAVAKIITWMGYNLNCDNYAFDSSLEALKHKNADYRWYAEIFYGMCQDAGINVEVVKGLHTDSLAYWNRVNIGGTWYYSDVWYYFVESYKNVDRMEYFLSESLWSNHTIKND